MERMMIRKPRPCFPSAMQTVEKSYHHSNNILFTAQQQHVVKKRKEM